MFVTLFNLQGAPRSLAAGVYFTILFLPCQALFSSFLKLFQPLSQEETFRLTPRPPLRTTCLYYQLSLALSSAFLNLFRFLLHLTSCPEELPAVLADSLRRIPHHARLVKHFFPPFHGFSLSNFLSHQCPRTVDISPQNSLLHRHSNYDTLNPSFNIL